MALDENHSLPGAISYLIYKDMIIQTASIAEAMLCYVLTKGIDKKKTSLEIMDIHDEDKYKNFIELYETRHLKSSQNLYLRDIFCPFGYASSVFYISVHRSKNFAISLVVIVNARRVPFTRCNQSKRI